MDLERRARLYERVERATELPLLILAAAMLPLIVIPLAFDLSSSVERAFLAANWFIWAVFAVELVVKTYLAPERRRYLVRHWFDVLIVVIPFLRPLRIVRSARALRLLRLVAFLSRVGLTWGQVFGRRGLGLRAGTGAVVGVRDRGAGGDRGARGGGGVGGRLPNGAVVVGDDGDDGGLWGHGTGDGGGARAGGTADVRGDRRVRDLHGERGCVLRGGGGEVGREIAGARLVEIRARAASVDDFPTALWSWLYWAGLAADGLWLGDRSRGAGMFARPPRRQRRRSHRRISRGTEIVTSPPSWVGS